jgi:hypothetical protein
MESRARRTAQTRNEDSGGTIFDRTRIVSRFIQVHDASSASHYFSLHSDSRVGLPVDGWQMAY